MLPCPAHRRGFEVLTRWLRTPLLALLSTLAVLGVGSLAGCDRQAAMNPMVDHAVDAEARRDFDLLAAHDPTLRSRMVPEMLDADATAQVTKMADLLGASRSEEHLVGYNQWIVNGDTRYELVYEARRQASTYPWVLERVRLHRTSDGFVIEGMNVVTLADTLEHVNAFTLERPAWMLAFLGGMALVAAFILVTLLVCARERPLRRKWAWLLFIAFGLGVVDLNWSNGAIAFEVGFSLLGAGFFSSGLAGPWVMKLALPIGAVLYWIGRRRRLAAIGTRETAASEPQRGAEPDPSDAIGGNMPSAGGEGAA